MNLRKTIFGLGMVVAACGHAYAADGDAGQLGSTIRIGQGARALAMGSAFSAISDDESAIFYNPAGSAQVRRPVVGFAWRAMSLLDRRQGYASASVPLREEATLGVAWVYSGVGDIVERNEQGLPGETFGFSENFLTLSFAKMFGRVVSVGGSVHFVNQSLFDVTANSVGLSVGTLLRFDSEGRKQYADALQRLTIGAVVQHVGMTLRFDSRDYYAPRGMGNGATTAEQYPIVVRAAAAYRLLAKRKLLVSAEGAWVEDQHVRAYAGAEWAPDRRLLLRAGLADTEPTFGLGLRQNWGKTTISFDYAFITSPVSEDADHVLSLGIAF